VDEREQPAQREPRAIDGLDWRVPQRPPAPPAPVPQGGQRPEPATPPRPLVPGQPPGVGDTEPPPAERPGVAPTRPFALLTGTVVFAALVGGIVGGVVVALIDDDPQPAAVTGGGPGGGLPRAVTVERTDAVITAAAVARPSIVRIESTRRTAAGLEQDVGSGVIIDNEGHIVTNAHVVLGTETLRVILADGSERSAILIGHDAPFTDVAVLQIGPGGLTPIEVGQSSTLALGETVLAIGNPLAEFEGSVTVGVVSGLNRQRTIDGVIQPDLIQTDAALNQGNSGGALVNLEGQFVGMPTSVLRQSRTGQVVEGIGFAIPADRLMDVARQIIARGGNLARPTMGFEHLDITTEVASRFRLPVDEGALVTDIAPGGPAAVAGIQRGDVITQLEDVAITRSMPFLSALASHKPGEAVRVVLNRNGRIIETEVRLGTRS
jgi:S1-C subfamily serine protease